jgi:predicted DNA-binding protein
MTVVELSVEQGEQQEMLVRAQQYQQELVALQEFQIEDAEDFSTASEILREVKSIAKEVESRRRKVTDPLNAAIKEFGKWYKPALDTLLTMEGVLKSKISEYTERQRVANEAAMRAAAAAARAGNFEAAHEASKGIVEEARAQGITTREVWQYEIEDLSQVPREYLALDHSAVKIYLKQAGAEPKPIPGLRFFKQVNVIARTG